VVISDRYLLANVVYQAHGAPADGIGPDAVWRVGEVTVAGIMPRLVLLLDMAAEEASKRIQREPDRMEAQGIEYLERVRQGFLTEAGRFPQQVIVLDAARPPDTIHAEVLTIIEPLLQPDI
jgi:dTMP kinase